jgi:hypothetical protein
MSREEEEKGGEMGMVKCERRGGSVCRDRGASKGKRMDHEPRGGRERWRDGDGENWKEWSGGSVWRDHSGCKGERMDHELRGWERKGRDGDGENWKEWSGVEVVGGGTAVRVKGRGGVISREEGEKGGEMRMVKFGRSGGSMSCMWRDRGARKVER